MRIRVGTSGWSYPSWRGGFYPAGTASSDFLRVYASRFDTVELNVTAYRLPAAEQFARWADAVPDGFRFAPKLVFGPPSRIAAFLERARALGDRLGPVRLVVPSSATPEALADALGRLGALGEVALDLRGERATPPSAVVVNDPAAEPFRYLRLRDPPYDDSALRELAASIRAPAYVYFRHEDVPTAPAYAARLCELLSAAPRPG